MKHLLGSMTKTTTNSPIILFDGVCNLCNASVQFIINRDPKRHFMFATLQGKTAQSILGDAPLAGLDLNSVVLVENGKLYDRSTAALRIARKLSSGWPVFYAFIIVPQFIRDGIYNWIAKNRYKWFGKQESCMMPTPELKRLFLDE